MSDTVYERIRNFRTERLSMIVADEGSMPLQGERMLAVHIIPFNAFDPSTRYDLPTLLRDSVSLSPIGASGSNRYYNFEGVVSYEPSTNPDAASAYLQVFRNGIIESVTSKRFRVLNGRPFIPSVAYERDVLEAVPRFTLIQKNLGSEPPLAIMVSMLGVRGVTLGVSNNLISSETRLIDRDSLILPEVIVEDFEFDPATALRPIFDSIWNATGYSRSLNYSPEGVWGEGPNSPH